MHEIERFYYEKSWLEAQKQEVVEFGVNKYVPLRI